MIAGVARSIGARDIRVVIQDDARARNLTAGKL